MNAVRIGVRMAVTITEAATWMVAMGAMAAYVGSAIATACGVPAAFPAVLDAAAPATPEPPSKRSAVMQTIPVMTTTATPRRIPGRPAVVTDLRLIPPPNLKAMNGTEIGP